MSYEVTNSPRHACDLPEPGFFPVGTTIDCTIGVLDNGTVRPCRERWERSVTAFRRMPTWRRFDWAW